MSGIGERIRRVRQQRGLSQTALARALPLSGSYLSLIEAGKRAPRPEVVESIARCLGCDPQYLLTGRGGDDAAELQLNLRFAELALRSGDAETARYGFDEALSRAHRIDDEDVTHGAVWGRCRAAERLGDLEAALEDMEWLARQDPLRGRVSRAAVLNALCRTLHQLGDLTRAIEIGERAVTESDDAVDLDLDVDEAAELASTLVFCYLERGDYAMARMRVERLVERADHIGSLRSRAAAYWNAGMVADGRGDLEAARRYTERALALYSESDLDRHLASIRVDCAGVLLRLPEPDHSRAARLLEEALTELPDRGSPNDVAKAELELARCQILGGAPEEAARTAGRARPPAAWSRSRPCKAHHGSRTGTTGLRRCCRGNADVRPRHG